MQLFNALSYPTFNLFGQPFSNFGQPFINLLSYPIMDFVQPFKNHSHLYASVNPLLSVYNPFIITVNRKTLAYIFPWKVTKLMFLCKETTQSLAKTISLLNSLTTTLLTKYT